MSGDVAARAAQISWYHTIELPGGVVTRGDYDLRPLARRVPLPESLAGMRCLDVGTSDGFWAFEMERRGAAEVVALDIDDPARYDWPEPRPAKPTRPANQEPGVNRGFALAHEALGSRVERVDLAIYELSPERIGSFDFVVMGALALHLRDPVLAYGAVRSVTRGQFLSVEVISLGLTLTRPGLPAADLAARGLPRWWTPNVAGHRRMLAAAGFEVAAKGGPISMPFGAGFAPPLGLRDLRGKTPAEAFFGFVTRRTGVPCAWARCRT
ncbi:MAG: tRNA (mo5U34)-methyltransferase [Thermoleophilaceae bacterium]|nr:tRNA (mo5U34)-methyltransferase [Thermoleophilaceae bacterium]